MYLDGTLATAVDQYSPTLRDSDVLYDSGPLSAGPHALKVVVRHEKSAAASDFWVECDKIEIETGEPQGSPVAQPALPPLDGASAANCLDAKIMFFGGWGAAEDPAAPGRIRRTAKSPYSACVFAFKGPAVRWIGSKSTDHGCAEVYLDDCFQGKVDTFHPSWIAGVALFEKRGLADGMHVLRIVAAKDKNPASTGYCQDVERFEARSRSATRPR